MDPETNDTWSEGDIITNPELADTLEKLSKAKDFAEEFYKGAVGKDLIKKIKKMDGILTMKDLEDYKIQWRRPARWSIQNTYDVFSTSEYKNSGGLYLKNGSEPTPSTALSSFDLHFPCYKVLPAVGRF